MPSFKAPGVFIREANALPPSIVGVETAVPVFIGYTQQAEQQGRSLRLQPIRIASMHDYSELFGGPFRHPCKLTELLDDKDKRHSEVTLGGRFYRLGNRTLDMVRRRLETLMRLPFDRPATMGLSPKSGRDQPRPASPGAISARGASEYSKCFDPNRARRLP
jgi:hypothetical protein